jgi:hypothetical protein
VAERRAGINTELAELTGGRITSIAQVSRIAEHLKERGHNVAGVGKRSVAAVLAHGPDEDIARLLRLRQEGGKASALKFDALFKMANDQRIHGACASMAPAPAAGRVLDSSRTISPARSRTMRMQRSPRLCPAISPASPRLGRRWN